MKGFIQQLTRNKGIGVRYNAAVETNGRRVEMITTANYEQKLLPLVGKFIQNINGGVFPEHVYYFRDGVSEGQYQHVLKQEVTDIRKCFKLKAPNWNVSS